MSDVHRVPASSDSARWQFSIVGLFLATTYAAVFSAAAAHINSRWAGALLSATPVCFIAACVVAIFGRGGKRRFACGFACGCVAYFGYSIASLFALLPAPHDAMLDWVPEPPMPPEYGDDYDLHNLNMYIARSLFCGSQCMFLCGIACGLLARNLLAPSGWLSQLSTRILARDVLTQSGSE